MKHLQNWMSTDWYGEGIIVKYSYVSIYLISN